MDPDYFNDPYYLDNHHIYMYKIVKGSEVEIPLSNFTARIVEDITKTNGAETERSLGIIGEDENGKPLGKITIPLEKFDRMDWPKEKWNMNCVIESGYGCKDNLRQAIQMTAKYAEPKTVYGTTGWWKQNGQWIFCIPGDKNNTVELCEKTKGYSFNREGDIDYTMNVIKKLPYGKTRKQTDCNGQTGYTMHILDDIIDKIVHDIFTKMKGIPKEEVITVRYGEELEQRKSILSSLQNDYAKEKENLNTLKSEVVKCIRGKSSFSQEMLSGLIAESETECKRLLDLCNNAEKEVNDSQNVLKELSESYDELISWAELYDDADFEKKKMIVNCLIRRVDVYSDYKLKIDFNFDFKQFIDGIDCIA